MSKAKDISKNCPKADRLWNGVETAVNLRFKRTEEPGRNQKEPDSYKARVKDDAKRELLYSPFGFW